MEESARRGERSLVQAAQRLGLEPRGSETQGNTVAALAAKMVNPFYQELDLLALAAWLLDLANSEFEDAITPWQIHCAWQPVQANGFGEVDPTSFELNRTYKTAARLFTAPDWCENDEERRKFQIGLLLRFAIRGTTAFDGTHTALIQPGRSAYKRPLSHWEQQRYSGYQGRSAFGAAWLPLSSFVEEMLFQLLRWPGAGLSTVPTSLDQIREEVTARLGFLRQSKGTHSAQMFLEQKASFPHPPPMRTWTRPLRVGVVQSITPDANDYATHSDDPELLKDKPFRARQRAHLAALMEGVSQMVRVRQTHRKQDRPDGIILDLLVFPELAIHPDDLQPLILPFVRKYKCMVLCGMVYHKEPTLPGSPLLNSCLWLVPEWTTAAGFQVRRIEQGKKHLAAEEANMTPTPFGFRPAQWLIEYEWTNDANEVAPLVLSASVCFDATDLALAADLRSRSDLYIVCALNKDVGTFDRMSEGLHYHMFQGVMVVNNGQFGGSSFFMPFKSPFHRQVFHLHGQPQASIAFAEIDPLKLLQRPKDVAGLTPEGKWKAPPAGTQKLSSDDNET